MLFGSKGVIGLDIGSSVVKAVQLRKSGKGLELEKFGMADIYPNGDKGNISIDLNRARAEAIKQALNNGKITSRNVHSSVGGEPVIVRYIQMHAMPEAELKNALQWEAEGYIPYEIDEVNIDSVILGPSSGEAGKLDVLLVAVKKDLINEHIQLIKSTELNPQVIDVDSFAFLNQFEYNSQPSRGEVIALIDIGAETTSISIYKDGHSRFSREISIAGDTITNSIGSKLNIGFGQAEQMKIQLGAPTGDEGAREAMAEAKEAVASGTATGSDLLERIRGTVERITGEDLGDNSPDAMARKSIKSTMGNLVSEIRRSLQFYENQAGGEKVARVMLGGGMSRLKGIDSYVSGELGLPAAVCDPLGRIGVKGKDIDPSQLAENKALLSVAIGLGLRHLTEQA